MARFVFFLLLLANAALAAWVYLHRQGPKAPPPPEVNAAALKIVSVTEPAKAQADALAARKLAASLSGAACVDFGVKPADGNRAQVLFASMLLGDRISSRNAEEFSRYTVALPAQKDRKSAETLMANLKKAGVKDVSILPDNAVSLGLYSTEEAAKKIVAELQSKAAALVKDVTITPRNPQLKEVVFTIREPDLNMVARLTLLQREYDGSTLKAIACPAAPLPSSVSVQDTKAPEKAKP
ncbi:MAG: SPOR domain-containing protein [Betaproteobacteria bacterium]|nr:SPOR domain-containing protein [Betaproteobacteria bacterium]